MDFLGTTWEILRDNRNQRLDNTFVLADLKMNIDNMTGCYKEKHQYFDEVSDEGLQRQLGERTSLAMLPPLVHCSTTMETTPSFL